jgi:hypothetical protein
VGICICSNCRYSRKFIVPPALFSIHMKCIRESREQ